MLLASTIHNRREKTENTSHKNQEISILRIKKRQSKVNISSLSLQNLQRRIDKPEEKDHKTNTNKGPKTEINTLAV